MKPALQAGFIFTESFHIKEDSVSQVFKNVQNCDLPDSTPLGLKFF